MSRSSTLPGKPTRDPSASSLLIREHLLSVLESAEPRRLVLLHAPAGFGKTTLLQQYHARLRGQRHALWLTLDEADNDSRRLLNAIEELLLQRLGTQIPERRYSHSALDRVESLIDMAGPLSLVLDEFEAIHSEPVLRMLRELISRLPEGNEFVIGTRHVPNIGVDRLRLQGDLVEIGVDELRFSLVETVALLRGERGIQLTESQLSTLHRRSEGWVGALQLFALSYLNDDDAPRLLESFADSSLQLAENFVTGLLARQLPDVREFLLQSCVLGEFTADLTDHVMQRSDSRELIDQLDRRGMFLSRLVDASETYRYHGLFAGMLRARAEPGLAADIHQRAADWYLLAQQPGRAIDHLLAAGNLADATLLMSQHARSMVADGRIRTLLRWFDRIPLAAIQENGELRLTKAWTLALSRRYVETNMLIDPILLDPTSAYRNEAQTIRSLCLWMADRMEDCFDEASSAILNLRQGNAMLSGILANILAHCHIAADRFDQARQALSQTLNAGYGRSHGDFPRIMADTNEAIIDLIQARLGTALTRLRNSSPALATNRRLSVRRGIMVTEVMLACASYERGDIDAAESSLLDVVPYVVEHGTPDLLITAYLVLSRIACAKGDIERAREYLDDLEREGSTNGLPRLSASAWLGHSWLAWQMREIAAAGHAFTLASAPSRWSNAAGYILHVTDFDSTLLMRIRLDIENNSIVNVAGTIRHAIHEATESGRHRRALNLRALLALAFARAGREADAMTAIGEALHIASREGHVRVFLDEGADLRALVQRWFADNPLPTSDGGDPFLIDLRKSLGRHVDAGTVAKSHLEPLTPRELDVLRLLVEGLRNNSIAARLSLSETTVRTHLRNINLKLQANNRTDAAAIARNCGLLD